MALYNTLDEALAALGEMHNPTIEELRDLVRNTSGILVIAESQHYSAPPSAK